jgi:lipopolysaccharide export system permease protein
MVVFRSYEVDLAQFGAEGEGAPLKPRERTTADLLWPNLADPYVERNLGALKSELHDRIVNPLYALAFGLIAFAALARPRTTRQGRGVAILGAVIAVAALRVAGFALAALATRQGWATPALYALPLLGIFAAFGAIYGDPFGRIANLATRLRAPKIGAA